jgi:hypothetical protein
MVKSAHNANVFQEQSGTARDSSEHPWRAQSYLSTMPQSPTCANCGRPMIETPRSMKQDGEWDVSVFECSACGIDFFTEDHVPLTGLARPRVGERFIAAMRRMILHTITPTRH